VISIEVGKDRILRRIFGPKGMRMAREERLIMGKFTINTDQLTYPMRLNLNIKIIRERTLKSE